MEFTLRVANPNALLGLLPISFDSDLEIMIRVYDSMREMNILDRLDKSKKVNDKSNEQSERCRLIGNELLQKREWLAALKQYNKCIALAEPGSIQLAFGYNNRSLLFHKKGYYKQCLKDIELALNNNYPEGKKYKLLNRRKETEKLISTQKDKAFHDSVPIIKTSSSIISCAADCVKINRNQKFGRFIEAIRSIKPGEIIAVERPFASIVLPDYKTTYCNHCTELSFNVIPCERCATEFYCNEECRSNAYSNYHKYECEVKQYFEDFTDENLYLGLRTTLRGLIEKNNNVDDSLYKSDRYKEITELISCSDKIPVVQKIGLCYHFLKIYHILVKKTTILTDFGVDKSTLMSDMFRDYLATSFNRVGIQKYSNAMKDFNETYGTALYAFFSLFNHSCNQNVGQSFYGSTIVLRASKTIKKGEQCFINYGRLYYLTPKAARQNFLRERFLFDCSCTACSQNWPMEGQGRLSPHNTSYNTSANFAIMKIYKQVFSRDIFDEKSREELLKICFTIAESIKDEEPSPIFLMLSDIYDKILFTGNTEIKF